jgi:hypothetical protein
LLSHTPASQKNTNKKSMGLTKDDKIDVPTTKFKKDGKKVGIEVTNQKYVQVVSNCKEEKLNH